MNYQLKTRQIMLFFIAFLPITKIFMMPSVIAGFAKEDMWISTLLNCILDFLTLGVLVFVCKKIDKPIFKIIEERFGVTASKVIAFLYVVFFMLKGVMPINEQKDYVEFTLYTLISTTFYFFPFFIVAFYFCTKKLYAVGRVSEICFIFTLLGLLVLLALSVSNADFTAVLPVFANGAANIFKGSLHALPWFGDCVYMLFFIGEFAYSKKDGIKIILSFLFGVLFVVAFSIIFYCIFTSIAPRQRFALTEISKYTTVINNTGRFDYFGILMILISEIFAITMPLFFATKLLNYIFAFEKKWIAPIFTVGVQLLCSIFLSEFLASLQNFIVDYCIYVFLFMQNVLPIFTLFLIKRRKKYELQAC